MADEYFWPTGAWPKHKHYPRPQTPDMKDQPGSAAYFKDMMLDHGLMKLRAEITGPILQLCQEVWLAARSDLLKEQERAKRP